MKTEKTFIPYRNYGLGHTNNLVLSFITMFGETYVSNKYLSEKLDVSIKTVSRSINFLVEKDLIKVTNPKGRSRTIQLRQNDPLNQAGQNDLVNQDNMTNQAGQNDPLIQDKMTHYNKENKKEYNKKNNKDINTNTSSSNTGADDFINNILIEKGIEDEIVFNNTNLSSTIDISLSNDFYDILNSIEL